MFKWRFCPITLMFVLCSPRSSATAEILIITAFVLLCYLDYCVYFSPLTTPLHRQTLTQFSFPIFFAIHLFFGYNVQTIHKTGSWILIKLTTLFLIITTNCFFNNILLLILYVIYFEGINKYLNE